MLAKDFTLYSPDFYLQTTRSCTLGHTDTLTHSLSHTHAHTHAHTHTHTHTHTPLSYFQMSKSKGNVVDPFDQISQFGLDPLRYFLLKEGSLYHNGGTEPSGLKLNLESLM